MLGLPHHQPVFSESSLPPPAVMSKPKESPVDVTVEVVPDVLDGKNVRDVVPAPIPPPDPKPAPEPKVKQLDIAEPITDEPSPEPADAEESGLDPQLEPNIQPIALWIIPQTKSPAIRPTKNVDSDEIIVLPGTRMTSKRIQ